MKTIKPRSLRLVRREALYALGNTRTQTLRPGKVQSGSENLYRRLDHWLGAKVGIFCGLVSFALCAIYNNPTPGIVLAATICLGLTILIPPGAPARFSLEEKAAAREWVYDRAVLLRSTEFKKLCRVLQTARNVDLTRSVEYWECCRFMHALHSHRTGMREILH